jgi:hypothetical protein
MDDLGNELLAVSIPNYEIYSVFSRWLRAHVSRSIATLKLQTASIDLIHTMASGSLSSFAEKFGALVLNEMPGQFFGNKEVVYQSWVAGYITTAAAATRVQPSWEVHVERYAGAGRLDLIMHKRKGKYAVIQEYRRLKPLEKEKGMGYISSNDSRLTNKADEALQQLEDRCYRAKLGPHVTELREYGVAFLGPYCAIVARSMRRADRGKWAVVGDYTAVEDTARRETMYTISK